MTRQEYLTELAQTTTTDDLRVEGVDDTEMGTRYQVEHVDAPALSGYFYVDAGAISPDMPTRAGRPRQYCNAAISAIRQQIHDGVLVDGE